MLRACSLGLLVLSGSAMALGCGVSAGSTGLTPAFADLARGAHGYIRSDLLPAIGTARFPMTLAASRARVKSLQLKVASEADKDLWLILTMINVKSSESNSVKDLSALMDRPSPAADEVAREAAAERDQCLSEADGWLSGGASKVASLKAAPCLRMVRQAAALLGR